MACTRTLSLHHYVVIDCQKMGCRLIGWQRRLHKPSKGTRGLNLVPRWFFAIRRWSTYSILVLVCRNVGALFYFNLTCNVTQDYIPKFLNAFIGVQEELGYRRGNSSCLFELPSEFPWEGGRVSATLSFLMSKLTVTWLLSPSPFSVELCNRARQSITCTHSQKKRVVVRQFHSVQSW